MGAFGTGLATGTVAGIASGATVAAMNGGRIDVLRVAADAFGNALGNALVSSVTSRGQQQAKQREADAEADATPGEPGPRNGQGSVPIGSDEEVGSSANWAGVEEEEPRTTSYVAKRGQGPLAIAANIDPDNEYAVMAYMAATGQMKYDAGENRWITKAGQEYTADLSNLSEEQIAQLDAAGRRAVSAESGVDARRAEIAAAQAALQQRQQEVEAQAAAQQSTAAPVAEAAASVGQEPSMAQQAMAWAERHRAEDAGFYTKLVNGDSAGWSILGRVGRALVNAGYDTVEAGIGLASLGSQAYGAVSEAVQNPSETASKLYTGAVDLADRTGAALEAAYEDPSGTMTALRDATVDKVTAAKDAVVKYVETTSIEQMGEDGLRVMAGLAVQAGVGKAVGAVGSLATKGLEVTAAGLETTEVAAVARELQVASGIGEAAPATIVREIQHGEKIADIVQEAKSLTFETGNEHALIKLENGSRVLVSGGSTGISFEEMEVTRIYGHTHPYQLAPTGPSSADMSALATLGQRSSYLLEHGQLMKYSVRP